MYRVLLEAESEGILHDVDMLEVQKLILNPKAQLESVGRKRSVEEVEEKKRRKVKGESEETLHDVYMTGVRKRFLGPEAGMISVGRQRGADVVKRGEATEYFELDKKRRLCGFCFVLLLLLLIYYQLCR